MRQLKISKSITNRESASPDKYLQEISREPMITVEEEVQLAQRIRQGDHGIGRQEMTLEEIGDYLGLTRERVRQIKEKALRRMRYSTRCDLLKPYL